jgi:hypothetical protein
MMAGRKKTPSTPAAAPTSTAAPPVCLVDGCTARKTYTRGLCAMHWCTRADLAGPRPAPEASVSALKTGRAAEDT